MEIEVDHSEHSKLRELIVEHLFIGEALRKFWRCRITDIEVLRSEIDSFGYDLVMSRGEIVRHIQLKTVKADGKANEVKVSLKLLKKQSGCIVWIVVNPITLKMESFLWFGNAPGDPLPDIADLKVAIHSKGDASGKKKERKDHRFLKRSRFEKVKTLDDVLAKLFGALPEEMPVP